MRNKLSQVEDDQLPAIYAYLILLREPAPPMFIKHLENMTLRRLNCISLTSIVMLTQSYAKLVVKGKISLSLSFTKTLEYIVLTKHHELDA